MIGFANLEKYRIAIVFAGAEEEFLDQQGCQAAPADGWSDGNVLQFPLAINAVSDQECEESWLRWRGSGGGFFSQQSDAVGDGSENFFPEEVSVLELGPVGRSGAGFFEGQDGGNVGGSGEAYVQVGSGSVAGIFFHLVQDFRVGAADVVGF